MSKLISIIILSLLTLTANCQKKSIAIFNYPLIAQPSYIDPITKDTITPVIMSQGFLDSCKNAWLTLNQHTTQINAANFSIQNTNGSIIVVSNSLNTTKQQVTKDSALLQGTAKQVGNTQIDVAKIQSTTDSIVNHWPSGGGGSTSTWRTKKVAASTYTITPSDSNTIIICTLAAGTKIFSTTLPDKFSCKIIMDAGQVSFAQPVSGPLTFKIKLSYTRIQAKNGLTEVNSDGQSIWVSGDLK